MELGKLLTRELTRQIAAHIAKGSSYKFYISILTIFIFRLMNFLK